MLVFREQNLGRAELAAFGRRFGKPKIHSLVDYRHDDYPEVSWLTNVGKDGKIDWFGVKRATDWHTDSPSSGRAAPPGDPARQGSAVLERRGDVRLWRLSPKP